MGEITYKNLFTLVVEEIENRARYPSTSEYYRQLERTSISPLVSSALSDITTASLITAVQNLLRDTISPVIIEGLDVTATDPISDSVTISAGKGAVGGKLYELSSSTTIKIPFNTSTRVFYINLYLNGILIDTSKHSEKLTIAKIIIPKPGITSLIQNTKDTSWNAYIVNFKEYKLYGDANGNLEEDSIEFLRENISPILADNIIGNLRLSENLKILNTAGTLELNSDSMLLKDLNGKVLAKFNQKGVYFYDGRLTPPVELARFTNIDSRIGNILITKNSIQSENFLEGIRGFRIKDNGDVEFDDGYFRGTLLASDGIIGGFTITPTKLYGGIIQTGENVGEGQNGVKMDSTGLSVYDAVLGRVVFLPSDGSAPEFSSGKIIDTVFEISTQSVLRTSETVGDGSALSYGILINNAGIYGCEANQLLKDANLKALIDGSVHLKGQINSIQGQIGSVTITPLKLSGGIIEGSLIRGVVVETSPTMPRIRIDNMGVYYQITTSIGKYGQFKYGDGTKYGAGVLAYLMNENYPVLSIMAEHDKADIRLYNRNADPETGSHEVGDVIAVDGEMKFCINAGNPGVFSALLIQNKQAKGLIIENRINDPDDPALGQVWLRTDV